MPDDPLPDDATATPRAVSSPRMVGVLALRPARAPAVTGAPSPYEGMHEGRYEGVDDELAVAMLEDTIELASTLAHADAAVLVVPDPGAPGWATTVEELVWPGTPVISLDAVAGHTRRDETVVAAALAALRALGAAEAAIVAGDCPDLPQLLIGKLFRALGSADVAVCPAGQGGFVAAASRLPPAAWAQSTGIDLDAADAYERLVAAAPRRSAVRAGPGWHRVRRTGDLARLDAGLEGWESTRAVVHRRAHHGVGARPR